MCAAVRAKHSYIHMRIDMNIMLHTSVILHCIFDYICYMFLSCISSGILPFDAFAEAEPDSEPGGVQSIRPGAQVAAQNAS